MILPDKKKATSLIISRMDGPDMEDSEDESMDKTELKDIAQQLMGAINNKSSIDVMDALNSFMKLIQEEDEEQDTK